MHKFSYENTYPDQLPVTVEFTIPSDASLDDMCQEFTNYLRAIGFHIPEGKSLDFVPEDGYSSKGWDSFEPDVTLRILNLVKNYGMQHHKSGIMHIRM